MNKQLLYLFNLIAALVLFYRNSYGQVNQLGAQFYQNQYLANPAMAGAGDLGWNIYLGYRQQFGEIAEMANLQAVTASYRFNNVGLGINVSNDRIGLFKRVRAVSTYSYHLPLDGAKEQLHVGLSLGVLEERINVQGIIGDQGDPLVRILNNEGVAVDGDLGFGYTNRRLNLQIALPNFRATYHHENRNALNRMIFFSAFSYGIDVGKSPDAVKIEPKLCYRVLQGDKKSIIDAGVNFNFMDNKFSIQSLYHTSRSITAGFNFRPHSKFALLGLYNSGSAVLESQAGASFEVAVQVAL